MLEWSLHVDFFIIALLRKIYSHVKYLYCLASRFIYNCMGVSHIHILPDIQF